MPAYDPFIVGGGMTISEQGGLAFTLPNTKTDRKYQITWGTRGYWCELCGLENKGAPVEIGSQRPGIYWVTEGTPSKQPAIDHMIAHLNED